MKILFITELYPEAKRGGEFIRNYGLYKMLKTSGHDVLSILGKSHYGAVNPMSESEDLILFDFTIHYNFKSQIKDTFLKFRQQPKMIKLLDKVVGEYQPDVVYWDYYYYGQYIPYFKEKGIPVIYGTHNVQPRLALQIPAKGLKGQISKRIIYKLLTYNEAKFFKDAAALIAVSDNDLEFYQKKFPWVKSYSIPNFLVESDYQVPEEKKENYIVMTGNFYAYQNAEGLRWFMNNVWDDELASKTKLVIAGRASDELHAELMKSNAYKSFEGIGPVDDMKPYISKAKLSIVPLLHGSGTRLKCIESMALKTQLVSTSQGAEGIDHQGSIAIANQPSEFKNTILNILNGETNTAQKAYDVFLEKYSIRASINKFNQILEEVV